MIVNLKSIAAIQMGYSFRSRLDSSTDGKIAVIQMKDLQDDNTVCCDKLIKIDMEAVKEHHLVYRGDLIFRSRGLVSTSAILLADPGKAVLAAPLLRIRVTKTNKIIPEYLNWFINQLDAQSFLMSRAEGSAQKMISKEAIENMQISLPSLEIQKKIIELDKLSSLENDLTTELNKKRRQYISTLLLMVAKEQIK